MPFLNTPLFGAPQISIESGIDDIQNNSPNLIVWAAPIMFFFVLLEWYISHKQSRNLYEKKETIGSILVGIGNVIINVALKLAMFIAVIWIYNMLPWRMSLNWW